MVCSASEMSLILLTSNCVSTASNKFSFDLQSLASGHPVVSTWISFPIEALSETSYLAHWRVQVLSVYSPDSIGSVRSFESGLKPGPFQGLTSPRENFLASPSL